MQKVRKVKLQKILSCGRKRQNDMRGSTDVNVPDWPTRTL